MTSSDFNLLEYEPLIWTFDQSILTFTGFDRPRGGMGGHKNVFSRSRRRKRNNARREGCESKHRSDVVVYVFTGPVRPCDRVIVGTYTYTCRRRRRRSSSSSRCASECASSSVDSCSALRSNAAPRSIATGPPPWARERRWTDGWMDAGQKCVSQA